MADLLKPFEEFLKANEGEIDWPRGSVKDPRVEMHQASKAQDELMKLVYAFSLAGMWWQSKAPNVELFPGTLF